MGMQTIRPGMNVAKQARKFDVAIERAPSETHANYLRFLKTRFEYQLAIGRPVPFSGFIGMYAEEFDLVLPGGDC